MTEEITGEHGIKSEDQTEEIFNQTFFRDFTFRSPRKDDKHKKEISDVLIGFDDVLFLVQVKSQKTDRDQRVWLQSNLKKAIDQLSGSINFLKRKRIIRIKDDRRGNFDLNIEDYKYIYGLVLINQPDKYKIDISEYKKEFFEKHDYPLQIMSLKDFNRVCSIFDTAEEFLHYYDVRNMVLTANNIYLHDEERFIELYVNNFTQLTKYYSQFINKMEMEKETEDEQLFVLERYYKSKYSGLIIDDHKYGKIIDEIIDHCHNFDPSLYDSINIPNIERIIDPKQYHFIAHELAKTGRLTRIFHGKKIMSLVHEAEAEGYKEEKNLTLKSKSRKTAYHYYIPNIGRTREEIFVWVAGYTMDYAKRHPEFNTVISVSIEFDKKGNVRYQYSMVKK